MHGGMRLLLLLVVSVCVSSVSGAQEKNPVTPKKALFLGNSLTASNDLPAMVEALSRAPGRCPLRCTAETVGGFSLEDHWNGGRARPLIARERWDFVVLQQGPSSLMDSRVNLRDFVRRFAPEIRRAGAEPALYMVWPERARCRYFDQVRDSYRLAAEDVKGIFLPAGEAWRAAWKTDPSLALYGPDAFHPSVAGTYLAALVIYAGLTGDSPKGLPYELTLPSGQGRKVQLLKALALSLQEAAADVIRQNTKQEP